MADWIAIGSLKPREHFHEIFCSVLLHNIALFCFKNKQTFLSDLFRTSAANASPLLLRPWVGVRWTRIESNFPNCFRSWGNSKWTKLAGHQILLTRISCPTSRFLRNACPSVGRSSSGSPEAQPFPRSPFSSYGSLSGLPRWPRSSNLCWSYCNETHEKHKLANIRLLCYWDL